MTKRLLFIVLIAGITISLVACSSRLTTEYVSQIKNGMTSKEVVSILGKPVQIESQSTLGISASTYTYRKDQSEVKIVFLNDKVTAVQSHLK